MTFDGGKVLDQAAPDQFLYASGVVTRCVQHRLGAQGDRVHRQGVQKGRAVDNHPGHAALVDAYILQAGQIKHDGSRLESAQGKAAGQLSGIHHMQ